MDGNFHFLKNPMLKNSIFNSICAGCGIVVKFLHLCTVQKEIKKQGDVLEQVVNTVTNKRHE